VKPFLYCPSCGARLGAPDGEGTGRCPSCGRVWYRNPAPTVGAAIVDSGRALVAVRAHEPFKGRIDVPGGFLNVGERPVDGLKREVREELGVEIDVAEEDYVQTAVHRYGEDGDWLVSMGFRARLAAGDPEPRDDVEAVHWVTLEDLEGLEWAWPHDLDLVRKALERR
jgi:ADP-ribose pyrophosphatase YjhB (NUDIX family)